MVSIQKKSNIFVSHIPFKHFPSRFLLIYSFSLSFNKNLLSTYKYVFVESSNILGITCSYNSEQNRILSLLVLTSSLWEISNN